MRKQKASRVRADSERTVATLEDKLGYRFGTVVHANLYSSIELTWGSVLRIRQHVQWHVQNCGRCIVVKRKHIISVHHEHRSSMMVCLKSKLGSETCCEAVE